MIAVECICHVFFVYVCVRQDLRRSKMSMFSRVSHGKKWIWEISGGNFFRGKSREGERLDGRYMDRVGWVGDGIPRKSCDDGDGVADNLLHRASSFLVPTCCVSNAFRRTLEFFFSFFSVFFSFFIFWRFRQIFSFVNFFSFLLVEFFFIDLFFVLLVFRRT